ncbi:hypothetical protein CBR_g4110 [Chara braunii]|uniref:Integrase catalytic domain-containing protein n=1 Tax=Chara braunii TaxID=69332 RepID=A0A388KHB0_CHABU|nr:hypothetical protein CBR_g4110 [Chara braunii]|eukprot:GBG69416.1 hypothetical protein CBR_g4110 [Chara braunii]
MESVTAPLLAVEEGISAGLKFASTSIYDRRGKFSRSRGESWQKWEKGEHHHCHHYEEQQHQQQPQQATREDGSLRPEACAGHLHNGDKNERDREIGRKLQDLIIEEERIQEKKQGITFAEHQSNGGVWGTKAEVRVDGNLLEKLLKLLRIARAEGALILIFLAVIDVLVTSYVGTVTGSFYKALVDQDLAQEGLKLRPVEYMSKKMPSQKLAKSTYEKELYAVFKALTHWRHYLLGRFFILRTDHQTLKWMRTQPVLSDALKCWIEVIEQYDFDRQYLKGEYNKVADALSRRPDFSGALITEFSLMDNVTQSLMEAYREDQFMFEIIRRLEAKDKKTSAEFELVNGLLFLEKAGNKRLCVPNSKSLRSLFLGECHDATSHFGYKKTAANLLQRFWWPTMMRDAQLYVETCQVCQRDKPRTQAPLGLLKPLPIPERPGKSLSMDFMDTLVTSKSGMRQIFVIVDRFSKYARLIAMPETAKTEYVIRLFKENRVRDFGLPKSIVSDRDVRFTSELWKAAAAEQGTQLQMTSGNHPEANGQAEQMNRAVQHLLRHYIKPNQVDWDEKLALVASLYNNVVHSATGCSSGGGPGSGGCESSGLGGRRLACEMSSKWAVGLLVAYLSAPEASTSCLKVGSFLRCEFLEAAREGGRGRAAGAFSLLHPHKVDGGEFVRGERGGVEWVGEDVGVGGGELVRGGAGGGVLGGDVVEEARTGRGRWKCGLVGGEDAVDLEGPSEEVGEGHGWLMVETDVLMSSMDDWRDVIMRKRAARSMAALGAGVCSPVRLRAMLSTESVRMPDISMRDDWAMVGEEAVVAAAEELAADEVDAAAAAAASATTCWEFLVERGMPGGGGPFYKSIQRR